MFAFPQLEVFESERKSSIVYQQNGAPLRKFRHALNAGFPNRWTGRSGQITWPPRSPDLTPSIFACRVYDKQCLHGENVWFTWSSRGNLFCCNDSHFDEIEYRLDVCRVTDCTHIKTYEGCQKILRVSLNVKIILSWFIFRSWLHFEIMVFFFYDSVFIIHTRTLPKWRSWQIMSINLPGKFLQWEFRASAMRRASFRAVSLDTCRMGPFP